MAKQYQWRTICGMVSPSGMSNGVTPGTYLNWQNENAGGRSVQGIGYWYRDTNYTWIPAPDENSTRAIYYVDQSWNATIDQWNVLRITMNTVITSIVRDDKQNKYYDGAYLPLPDTPCRGIYIFDGATGQQVDYIQDCLVGTEHTISGYVNFSQQEFTIYPGSDTTTETIIVHNETQDSQHDYDDISIGVQFKNPLPAPVNYKLNYNANGGSGAPASDVMYTVDDSHTFTVDNTVPTRANYRFDGWSESPSGPVTYHGGDSYTVYRANPEKTLYAIWTPYWTATVTYNANGGTGAPAAQTASVNPDYSSKSFTVPSGTPTWGHYKFLGWSHIQYVDSRTDADVEYRAGDTVTVTTSSPSLTLYAVWMMDYRPGATLNTNTNIWKSHNRTNGACHVLSNTSNMTWQECRTIGGAEGDKGNPPLILTAANANSWRNQKLLGKE